MDKKETSAAAYTLPLAVLSAGTHKAARHGYEFALQVKFMNSDIKPDDYMVIPTSLFDELLRMAGAKVQA